ncbi:hypothetical protein KR222_006145 [Zaprionus bogoriensis]|nr:hypothetical protein KR222_006145 [Zaprionus bogoriensis]
MQFRIEGFHLRRTTVVTGPFDMESFQAQHKQMLADASDYAQVGQVLNVAPTTQNKTPVKAEQSSGVASTIPCSSTALGSGKTESPRSRKRKAMQSGIQHVERKALQRRLMPVLQYKDSESQEDDLEACVLEVDKAEAEVEAEAADDEDVVEIKREEPDTSFGEEITEVKDELEDIMQLINRTATQTRKLLEEHNC